MLVNAYISGMNTISVLSELMSKWGFKEFDLVYIHLRWHVIKWRGTA